METTTVKTKKISLKNAIYAHLKENGDLIISYESTHKDSGKKVDWQETILKNDLPFKLRVHKSYWKVTPDFNYKWIYFSDYLLPLLNDISSIEIYPKNNSEESTYLLRSIYIELKNKAKIPFHFYQYDGKKFEPSEIAIIY